MAHRAEIERFHTTEYVDRVVQASARDTDYLDADNTPVFPGVYEAGDPTTHLAYSSEAHRHAAVCLCELADRHCRGRLLALGGGGYNLKNLTEAWCVVVQAMIEADEQ